VLPAGERTAGLWPGGRLISVYLPQKEENPMMSNVGLWIDHRKAVIVTVTEMGQVIKLIISALERQARRAPTSRHSGTYEPQKVPADDSRQRAFTGHLNIYYDVVIAAIRGAESILLFGPGEAKGELRKRLKGVGLDRRIVRVETVDKMTDRQIAAKVNEHFAATQSEDGRDRRSTRRALT
jgi:hypothetical protein